MCEAVLVLSSCLFVLLLCRASSSLNKSRMEEYRQDGISEEGISSGLRAPHDKNCSQRGACASYTEECILELQGQPGLARMDPGAVVPQ